MSLGILKKSWHWIAVWLVAVLNIASMQFVDPDLWGRLSVAALLFQNGRFPYYDVFSYTATQARWIDHEWLTGVVFYSLFLLTGETGFLVFKYLLILATLGWLFLLHRRAYQVSPLYAFYGLLALVGVYSVGYAATLRSQVFSFFFFTLFIYLLERVRLGQRPVKWLGWLLPLGILWGNFHGGFIMGILLLLCYALGAVLSQSRFKAGLPCLGVAGLLLGLVGLVNPYGPDYLKFLIHAWTLNRSYIPEWHALDLSSSHFWGAQWLMAGLAILALLRILFQLKAKRPKAEIMTPLIVLCLNLAMAIKGVRFQTFLALAAVAYAPVILSPTFFRWLFPRTLIDFINRNRASFQNQVPALCLGGSVAGLAYLGLTVGLFKVPLGDELTMGTPTIRYPLAAIQYLKESPYSGNLMIRFGLGEFAYWTLYPRFKVSMDGRYEEVYTQDQFLRNFRFFQKDNPLLAQQALDTVNASPADFIIIDPHLPAVATLSRSPDWRVLYSDDWFVLLGRISTLSRYPSYQPAKLYITTQTLTLQDFVRSADLRRFKH